MTGAVPVRRLAALLAYLAGARAAAAQAPTDSTRADSLGGRLGAVVVTAERAAQPLAASAAAVTRLSGAALRQSPVSSVANALELVPGIAVLHSDALGDAPRLAVRGFYGGGETEYVSVLLDGVPVTSLTTGQVNWDLVPLAAVDAVEVVRGGASAAYGDAALGGVVNLVTRRAPGEGAWSRWRATAGELGTARVGGAAGGALGARAGSIFGDVRRSDGFRARERRASGTLGGSLDLARGDRGWLAISTLNHRRTIHDPGALTGDELAASREGASPFSRFDETTERVNRLGLDGLARVGRRGRFTGYLTGEHAASDGVRSVPLAPDFADAQQRRLRADRVVGSAQLETSGLIGRVASRLVLGTDAGLGRLTSAYRPVVTGDSSDFAQASGAAGDVAARGRGRRANLAAFANWELAPTARVRVTLGARADRIADRYGPESPSDGETSSTTHTAFSPRGGVNVRWLDAARQTGNVYASVGRSFKAPTMDQLFDQRAAPVPFPPYSITTNNPELDPQYGTSVEAGLYHRVALGDATQARFAASVYQMDMKDELDFDLQQFKYVNLGRSRHRGLETGLTLDGPAATHAWANATLQHATSRFGEDEGKQLKAVPRQVYALGASRAPSRGLGLSATATTVAGTFLDDANAIRLPAFTRLDVRASYPVAGLRLAVNVRNLFDRAYSTTGFPDPAGSDVLYFYPAAGRVVTLEIGSR